MANTPIPPQFIELTIGMDPFDAHCWFERIHPFADGNGRTGRMLLWWQQLREDTLPTMILNKDKIEYYQLLAGSK